MLNLGWGQLLGTLPEARAAGFLGPEGGYTCFGGLQYGVHVVSGPRGRGTRGFEA